MTAADHPLRIAPDLALPAEAVTETFAILAKRGAGKTHTASVMVEEFIGAGLPVCVIDPVGVWWGLRSSADGQGPGLPVVIFGGDHADLPLPEGSGELLADLVIDERMPAVLDLSLLSKSAQRRFVTAFMERLYHRNRDPLHLVVDEADLFAPTRATADVARGLGAYEDIVRRGRAKGLGCTSITQRPAVLHNDIRTQSEVLIALRMTGLRDVKAIDEWVQLHGEDGPAAEVKASLPSLPIGTAWVWSPGWLGLLQRVQVRRRRTFDSSATPKPGQRVVQPRRFADVDLARLKARLEATADADTPPAGGGRRADAALHAEVARLRRDLAAAQAAKPEVVTVEVPVVADGQIEALQRLTGDLAQLVEALRTALARVARADPAPLAPAPLAPAVRAPAVRAPVRQRTVPPAAKPAAHAAGAPGLKQGARRMLEVAARNHPLRVTRAQLATLAGLRVTGGTFGTYYSVLRQRGLLAERDGLVEATADGRAAAGVPEGTPPMTGEELREQWRGVLKAGARAMLDHLLQVYPSAVGRAELAAAVDLEPSGGTFGTYLSHLRRNGLADVAGDQVRAAEVFFLTDVQRP